MHCQILAAKGGDVIQGDFLSIAGSIGKFDRIVMNPPYSEGRWDAHTKAAARLLNPNGVLVAILPESAKNSLRLPGSVTWSRIYSNEFAGTGVRVVIMRLKNEQN